MNEFVEKPKQETEPPRNSKELVKTLGFTLDKKSSTGRKKIYTKPFGAGGRGWVAMSVDTVYKPLGGEKPYQKERIGFSVRLDNNPNWERVLANEQIEEILNKSGLETTKCVYRKQSFEASSENLLNNLNYELNEGGSIYDASKRLISEMVEEQAKGNKFIEDSLIPEMQEKFPKFPYISNEYRESREVYFVGKEEKGKNTVPVIRFFIRSLRIGDSYPIAVLIEYGRSKIQKDNEKIQVDGNYFYSRGNRRPVMPPDRPEDDEHSRRSSWTLDELDQALEKLKSHMEGN